MADPPQLIETGIVISIVSAERLRICIGGTNGLYSFHLDGTQLNMPGL